MILLITVIFFVQCQQSFALNSFEAENHFEAEFCQLLDMQASLQNSPENKTHVQGLMLKRSYWFWHLNDPIIGMHPIKKEAQLLSWHFSLWELAPKKGKLATIAIIDGEKDSGIISLKGFCKTCLNKTSVSGLNIGYCLFEKLKNISLCERCYNRIFFYFLKNSSNFHGMITHNIIYQLAPEATIVPYNIFDNSGYSDNQKLLDALSNIAQQSFDIVNLGCKTTLLQTSLKNQEQFESQLGKMHYIVAASGNDAMTDHEESYPAKNKHVCFDVGAFCKNNKNSNSYSICPFSQFKTDVGPKIVAPGSDILCPFTCNDHIVGFSMISGTSVATAIISGLLALVASEFKQTFSYKQILTVLYRSSQKLGASYDWQEGVFPRALDIRSALFCLHVLQKIKLMLPNVKFLKLYDKLVEDFFSINSIYLYEMSENKDTVQSFLQNYKEKGDVEKRALYIAKTLLVMRGISIKTIPLKKSFDKKLVYLLRTIKSRTPVQMVSFFKHEKVQFALNRKS